MQQQSDSEGVQALKPAAEARISLGGRLLAPAFFRRPAPRLAADLIGAFLFVDGVGGMIVEAEAYTGHDAASHSFAGPTPRNAAMFGPIGCAYVYRSYGMHWCLNLVCGVKPGSAVLLRALEPLEGVSIMAERRGVRDPRLLCSGPGRLCQALGVSAAIDGASLHNAPFRLEARRFAPEILIGGRIGITRATERLWRFGLAGSRFLSRPFSAGRGASRI
jgi:DNA-3-methyladenine glycosylase